MLSQHPRATTLRCYLSCNYSARTCQYLHDADDFMSLARPGHVIHRCNSAALRCTEVPTLAISQLWVSVELSKVLLQEGSCWAPPRHIAAASSALPARQGRLAHSHPDPAAQRKFTLYFWRPCQRVRRSLLVCRAHALSADVSSSLRGLTLLLPFFSCAEVAQRPYRARTFRPLLISMAAE